FDHGASVVTGVSVRATFTTLVLFVMMRLQGVSLAIPRALRGRTLLAGLLIATQSYCLYSAVALIPPALALLVFQTSPMLYVLLTWALGREAPRWRALWPMALALAGLALALNLRPAHLAADWAAVLAGFYCVAMASLFFVLPRIPTTSTAALNFEPIALLVLGWVFLGFTVTPLQLAGAVLTVSAIAWLGLQKH